MSLKEQYTILFSYHWHTNRRLLACAGQLDESARRASISYGRGSIQELFFHLLRADQGWRDGLETLQRGAGLLAADFPTLESIMEGFVQEEAAWNDYLDRVTQAEIEAEITLTDQRGNQRTFPCWRILQHLILHGMQHHSELAQLLTLQGQSPGDLDFFLSPERLGALESRLVVILVQLDA